MKRYKKNWISIVVVNFNGKKWLRKCFTSVYGQSYKKFELIMVDNNSSDDSVAFVKKNFPQTIIVESKHNGGFAEGNNLALDYCSGEYVVLLNNDTIVEKNYLKNFVKVFQVHPKASCAQSKIVLMDNDKILDFVGAYLTDSSLLYYYGLGKNANLPKYNKPMIFFHGKAASMIIKRDLIDKIGLFDVDFWCYYEEVDFCHRLWLAGYESWYWPEAVCYHAGGGTSITFDNAFIQFHSFKNKLMSFIKNFGIVYLFWELLVFLLLNIGLSFYWLLKRRGGVRIFWLYIKLCGGMLNIYGLIYKKESQSKK